MDLEANPTVDAEHPADLKHLTESAATSVEEGSGSMKSSSAPKQPATEQDGLTGVHAKQSSPVPPQPPKQSGPQATDVNAITESILSKVSSTNMVLRPAVSTTPPPCTQRKRCVIAVFETGCSCARVTRPAGWLRSACAQVSAAYAAALDGKGLSENIVRPLAADIEMQLNALRNAAYAKGVTATRAQFGQFAEAPFRCLSK